MSTINSLIKIILELKNQKNVLPIYRNEEITEAEDELLLNKVEIRKLLSKHKTAVEDHLKLMHNLEANNEYNKLSASKVRLKELCNSPDVALTIMISKYQQLQRGIKIYKYERIKRIINRVIIEVCSLPQELEANYSPSDNLLNNCSSIEKQLLNTMTNIVNDLGVTSILKGMPNSSTIDINTNKVCVPAWLINVIKNEDKIKKEVETAFSVSYSYSELCEIKNMYEHDIFENLLS